MRRRRERWRQTLCDAKVWEMIEVRRNRGWIEQRRWVPESHEFGEEGEYGEERRDFFGELHA